MTYVVCYENHPDEKQTFPNVELLPKGFFTDPDEFDTSVLYNTACGLDLRYRDFEDMECTINYPTENAAVVTIFCF